MKRNEVKKGIGLTIGKIILLSFLSVLMLFLIFIYLFINFDIYKPSMDTNEDHGLDVIVKDNTDEPITKDENVDPTTEDKNQPKFQRKNDERIILIAARDRISSNTDVMILCNLNFKTGELSILQLPRDTYVNNQGYSVKKLNAVFSYSYAAGLKNKTKAEATELGIKSLKAMIKQTFGLPVDKYIFVDTKGFKALVDLIGGVDMYVPRDMFYEDPYQDLYINLKKGQQNLNGDEAEQYVRYRAGYPDGDIGRLNAQKLFLAALVKKMLKTSITQINGYVELANKYITSDMSTMDMLSIAKEIATCKPENIRIQNVPGEEMKKNKLAYFAAYKKETMEIINKYYNPYKETLPAEKFDIYEFDRKYKDVAVDIDGTTFDSFK